MSGVPVSGPAQYSQRTDRQPIRTPTGMDYGQHQALDALQHAAPLSASGSAAVERGSATAQAPAAGPDPSSLIPLFAPTQNPNEPVTAGAATGAGPGPEALGPSGPDGAVASLQQVLSQLPASPEIDGLLSNLNLRL